MPTTIEDIVEVQVSLDSSGVPQTGFGVPLILGVFPAGNNWEGYRAKEYGSYSAVLEDFTDDASGGDDGIHTYSREIIQMAKAFFSQPIKPKKIVVGQIEQSTVQSHVIDIPGAVTAGDVFTLYIAGKEISVTAESGNTEEQIYDKLKAAIEDVDANDDIDAITSVTDNTTSMTIAFTTDVSAVIRPVTDNITVANNTGTIEAFSVTLPAILDQNTSWFSVCLARRGTSSDFLTDLTNLATEMEAYPKKLLMFTTDQGSTASAPYVAGSGTDVGAVLRNAGFPNISWIWSNDELLYPECRLLGRLLPQNPGSYNPRYTRITGVSPDVLTDTYITNITNKYGTTIESISGGDTMIANAVKMADGTYLDIYIIMLCVEAWVRESVMRTLTSGKKIPFTNAGLAAIRQAVLAPLNRLAGPDYGAVIADSIVVTVPDASEVDPADKSNRYLNQVTFSATLQGAVDTVKIVGTLKE